MKILVGASIGMKALGGLIFIFGSSLGAYLLVCDFILPTPLFVIQMDQLIIVLIWVYFDFLLQLLHQAIATPILYDFYNYDMDTKEFAQLFIKFTQVSTQQMGASFYCPF